MKAVVCTQYGPPEVLQIRETEKPVPQKDQILIRIVATAVNSGDTRVRSLGATGFLKIAMCLLLGIAKPRKPILGNVFSGVVEAVGDRVDKFKAGDQVFGMTGFKFGTYAEYIAVNQNGNVAEMPQNATFEEAAAIIFGGSTAIYFLRKAKLDTKPYRKVLIYGATGSVGSSAVQIAKFYKALVTAVCGGAGTQLTQSLGADYTINYTREDFTQTAEKFDVIFDCVGKINKKSCAHLLLPDGKYISVGQLDIADEHTEQLLFLKILYEQGKLQPVIDRIYPLDGIIEAHRYADTGRKKGNVVIRIGE